MKTDFPSSDYAYVEPIPKLNESLRGAFGEDKDFSNKDKYDNIDFITCLDVIEHIEDDQKFVEQTVEKMEVGCRLVITVPALSFLWSQWDQMMGHYRRYNKKGLRQLFESSDVKIHRLHYLFPEMFFAGLLRKTFPKKEDTDSSEFPVLSPSINQLFYNMSNTTRKLGSLNPLGSSLLIDVTKL